MAHWAKADRSNEPLPDSFLFRDVLCFILFPVRQWQVLGIAALQTDDIGSFGYLPLGYPSWKELMLDACSQRMTVLRVLTPEEITKGKLQFAGMHLHDLLCAE